MKHLTADELEAGLDHILHAPKNDGVVELIVRRPAEEERETMEEAEMDPVEGLIGDNWKARGSRRTGDGSAHPEMQLTIMNSRSTALLAQSRQRWQLAGDQLYVDMDLGTENLPPGTLLQIGTALIEVTAKPHTGCKKFVSRFGLDAMKFVNSEVGRKLNLRGINAKIVKGGRVRVGDVAKKIGATVGL